MKKILCRKNTENSRWTTRQPVFLSQKRTRSSTHQKESQFFVSLVSKRLTTDLFVPYYGLLEESIIRVYPNWGPG
jgi:hypothetical protein